MVLVVYILPVASKRSSSSPPEKGRERWYAQNQLAKTRVSTKSSISHSWMECIFIFHVFYIKIEKYTSSSCEIEYFVETHICTKLCVILRSRVLRVVCPHQEYSSATPLATTV